MKNFTPLPALLLGVLIFNSCMEKTGYEKSEPVRPVKTVTLESTSTRQMEFQGIIESDKQSRLAFRTGGQIIVLNVDIGDRVKAGQIIAQLDKKEMLDKLETDRVVFTTAQSIYNRDLELHKRKAISTQELEISRNNFERAKFVFENTQSQLNDMTLTAPFDGIVEEVPVELYQRVGAGEEIVKLIDPNDLVIQMKVADRNFELLRQSPEFKVSIEALPGKTFEVTMDRFLEASPSGVGIPVFLAFKEGELTGYRERIRPGFAATISMTVTQGSDEISGYMLPLTSVFSDPNSDQLNVWVVNNDMSVSKRPVQTGEIIGNSMLEINSGVSENEVIVSAGVNFLQEGQKVKILQD